MVMPKLFMVFDVESVGLDGEGYAVGWVVVTVGGIIEEECGLRVGIDDCGGSDGGREWVMANANDAMLARDRRLELMSSPRQLRRRFWEAVQFWQARGAVLVADCGWPVEARFLAACVDDDCTGRSGQGPYPLHELATLRLVVGFDPLASYPRVGAEEIPAHNPICDARQSARLWLESLARAGGSM